MHCNSELRHVFADLDYSPVSNEMLNSRQLRYKENYYPLKVFVCDSCFLVQHEETKKAIEIFDEKYTYFSSFSKTWLNHAKNYVDMMMDRFNFNNESLVLEIASNDGYLLRYFKDYKVNVLGIEPASNTALEAEKLGVKSITEFFNMDLVENRLIPEGYYADLVIGNNVLAHVPNINNFIRSMKKILKSNGIITMEFPHLVNLINEHQFDTIYHEHFSYLSLYSVNLMFKKMGLKIFDCEKLETHGGSLRIFAAHEDNDLQSVSREFRQILEEELRIGVNTIDFYLSFQNEIHDIKYDALLFLIDERKKGKKIAGYGAAAKGNTFLNYCGIHGTDLIQYVVDASPFKQGKFLPGSHIPVVNEEHFLKEKPDYIVILPWNLKHEISTQLNYVRDWGCKFVIFIPKLTIF